VVGQKQCCLPVPGERTENLAGDFLAALPPSQGVVVRCIDVSLPQDAVDDGTQEDGLGRKVPVERRRTGAGRPTGRRMAAMLPPLPMSCVFTAPLSTGHPADLPGTPKRDRAATP